MARKVIKVTTSQLLNKKLIFQVDNNIYYANTYEETQNLIENTFLPMLKEKDFGNVSFSVGSSRTIELIDAVVLFNQYGFEVQGVQ